MANRNFQRKQALEKEIKELYLKCTFGASGAVTANSKVGIASIAKSATGDYLITLQDKYVSLKNVSGVFLNSSAQDIRIQLKAEDVDVAKTLSIYTLTGVTPTDPASGSSLLLKIELKNTSAV